MEIRDLLTQKLKGITEASEVKLDFPDNPQFGDYATNVAMTVFADPTRKLHVVKEIKGKASISDIKNPREFAEIVVGSLKRDEEVSKFVEKIEVAGPGFINFWLKTDVLVDNLIHINKEKEKYGTSKVGSGQKVVVDYSSPNIAKAFGIGHLRSTIIGQALVNLYKSLGYEVVGDNHLGDWGTQFGKLICMIEMKGVEDFDIEKLEELYVEFHKLTLDPGKKEELEAKARECFKKLEEGDSEMRRLWKKCVDVSLTEFNRIYEKLGVKIDFAFGESYYENEMKEMERDSSIQKHLIDGEDGAKIINLESEGISTPLMFLKSDGATTYATRDLATLKFRMRKWDPDLIIYEVGAEQSLHFEQVFAAARILGIVKKETKLIHTAHGLYLAPDGKKFSTRKGKTIKLEEVLDEAIERAKELGNENSDIAKEVGMGAIKYYDLMHSVQSNVVFDWEKIMNMEGNSGPYLQYTVARCNSVLSKTSLNQFKGMQKNETLDIEESIILRSLIRFGEVNQNSARSFAPNLLCNYLYDLAQKYNSFYNKDKIIGSESEEIRVAITSGVSQVLKNGLKLLGIETPERM